MTPEDLMRSMIGPACAGEQRETAIATLTLQAGAVLRDARVAGSSGRGLCLRRLTPSLILRSDAKHRVSKDARGHAVCKSSAQLYAGSVAGRGLNPSGMTFEMPCRTSSGVIPIAAHPFPP